MSHYLVDTSASSFSESPTYGEYNWAPLRDKNVAWTDVAAALTRVVLQQPGGPYSSNPLGTFRPSRSKESGCLRGHSTACETKQYCNKDFFSELTVITKAGLILLHKCFKKDPTIFLVDKAARYLVKIYFGDAWPFYWYLVHELLFPSDVTK